MAGLECVGAALGWVLRTGCAMEALMLGEGSIHWYWEGRSQEEERQGRSKRAGSPGGCTAAGRRPAEKGGKQKRVVGKGRNAGSKYIGCY